jgi:hypothetical protein
VSAEPSIPQTAAVPKICRTDHAAQVATFGTAPVAVEVWILPEWIGTGPVARLRVVAALAAAPEDYHYPGYNAGGWFVDNYAAALEAASDYARSLQTALDAAPGVLPPAGRTPRVPGVPYVEPV